MDVRLERLKENLRESDYPFFEEAQLIRLLEEADGNVDAASYRGLIIKAEQDGIDLSDLQMESMRGYWLSLARLYRPDAGGVLKRGDGN